MAIDTAIQDIDISNTHKSCSGILIIILYIISFNYQEPSVFKSAPQHNDNISPETVVKAYCDFDVRGKHVSSTIAVEANTFYCNLVRWDKESIWGTMQS